MCFRAIANAGNTKPSDSQCGFHFSPFPSRGVAGLGFDQRASAALRAIALVTLRRFESPVPALPPLLLNSLWVMLLIGVELDGC